MENLFTVDLEDWYCTQVMESVIKRSEWGLCESRVRIGTLKLLRLLERRGIEGTFFVLGYIADREPALVREIAEQGHEIATHGYSHRSLTTMRPEEFRNDLERSLESIERVCGQRVVGYRAPNFSMTPTTAEWAPAILKEFDIHYDASLFPLAGHPMYGIPDARIELHYLPNGIIEIPISSTNFGRVRLPATGGGYFRHSPFLLSRSLMRRCNRQGRPVVFYIHPWELDPGQPRIGVGWSNRLRHYREIEATERKLQQLTEEFPFTSIRRRLTGEQILHSSSRLVLKSGRVFGGWGKWIG